MGPAAEWACLDSLFMCSFGSNALAKTAQDNHAADSKTGDGSQSQGFGELRIEVEEVIKKCGKGENNSEDVKQRRLT